MILHLQAHLTRRDISAAQTVNQYGIWILFLWGQHTYQRKLQICAKIPFHACNFYGRSENSEQYPFLIASE